jgi:putative DNA primase/helicase
MPAVSLRERLASIYKANEIKVASGMLKIIAGDLLEDRGVGNLASAAVQRELEPWLGGVELIILDNLSSLTSVVRDNDAESWIPIQQWLLRLRRRGLSVLIIHHAGKGGEQRGTSKREDDLDTSICLRRPSDYVATEGARFEVLIEKGRDIHGAPAKSFEARLQERDGIPTWTVRDLDAVDERRVASLLESGLSVRDIAEETGITKSTIHRLKQKIEVANAGAPDAV